MFVCVCVCVYINKHIYVYVYKKMCIQHIQYSELLLTKWAGVPRDVNVEQGGRYRRVGLDRTFRICMI